MNDWMTKALRRATHGPRVRGQAVSAPEKFGAAGLHRGQHSGRPKILRPQTAPAARKKLGYKLNDEGARRLICAVMEQAVVDFKILVRHGRIVNGKAMPSKRNEIVDGYEHQDHVKQLLHFFQAGGPMDTWLLVAGIKINPNLIRLKLGIP